MRPGGPPTAAQITPRRLAVGAGLLSLLLGAYQLTRPGVLTGVLGFNFGYDDSVHIGVPTRIVHGTLPYRDFVFVHPPGIAYVLLPFALVGRAIGTFGTVMLARILTVAVVAANAALSSWLVRRSGRLAMLVTGLAVALWPLTPSVDRNTELEPYLVLFCLLGAVLVFGGDAEPGRRRLLIGGALLGFAGATKVWAVLPIVAAVMCCLPDIRRRVQPVVTGILAGGVLPLLPFFLLAPSDFVHDVITSQLNRKTSVFSAATPFGDRLLLLSGLGGWGGLTDNADPAIAIFVVLLLLVAVAFGLGRKQRSRVEWFVLASAATTNAGMFVSPEFVDHYAYFPMVFLALLLGVSAAATVDLLRTSVRGATVLTSRRTSAVAGVLVVALVVSAVLHNTAYARLYLAETSDQSDVIASLIPEGACVLSDYPIDLLVADRFTPDRGDCPAVVDPFGMYLTEDNGQQPHPNPPYQPAFLALWRNYLERADYVILRIEYSSFLPWSQDQINWFAQHYELIGSDTATYDQFLLDPQKRVLVYRNRDRTAAPTLTDASVLVQNGLNALNAGRVDEARDDFTQALTLDPNNKFAAYDLGVIAQNQGNTQAAIDFYRRAVKIDPAYKPALNNLAIVLTPGQPEGAIALYRTLLQLDPNDAGVHLRLGLVLDGLGRTPEADQQFDAAVQLDPTLASQVPTR